MTTTTHIFCDAVNGYGDISLTLKILKQLIMRVKNIKVLFYLRKQEQKQSIVINMIDSFNIRGVEYIFLFENEEIENKNRMEQFEENMESLIIIPQSNLTLTIYENICNKYNTSPCKIPDKLIGITEYNVEEYNISDVKNPLIKLGFNQTGVLIDKDAITQIKNKDANILKTKYEKQYKTDKLYLAYISEETFESYLTLLSYFNEDDNYVVIAPKIKNTNNYDVNIYNKRLTQDDFRNLTYISNNPIGVTGDQSFIDALILGKVCYYDKPPWKEHMIDELVTLLRQQNFNLLADWYESYETDNLDELTNEANTFSNMLLSQNLNTYDKIVELVLKTIQGINGGKIKKHDYRRFKKTNKKSNKKSNKKKTNKKKKNKTKKKNFKALNVPLFLG
jgi:hypothetical protein